MNIIKKLAISSLLSTVLLGSAACKKGKLVTDVKFLGHKGAGGNYFNKVHMENTIPSFAQAIETLDGVETDVAMSLDGTIWMYHNQDVNDYACDEKPSRFIPAMHDNELEKVMLCYEGKRDRMYRFSELVKFWESKGRSFYISLDVKPTFPAWVFSLAGGRSVYYDRFAESLSKLFTSPDGTENIFLEFDNTRFLSQVKLYEETKKMIRFYTGDGGMENHISIALARDYDGVSVEAIKATAEEVQKAKAAGLKVQLWTPYFRDELRPVVEKNPDFIHTDNIHAKKALNIAR
ncbi:Glycerophosphoryl diester phosphodiesterase family protein [compost metagenome]